MRLGAIHTPAPAADEEWLPIPGFEGSYSASSFGRIRSEPRVVISTAGFPYTIRGAILKAACDHRGYPAVSLYREAKRRKYQVHQLVAETFFGPPLSGQEVRHLDGTRNNNKKSNLSYGTRKENHADRERHGRTPRGEANGNALLTASAVKEIKRSNDTQIVLAQRFGVSREAINDVRQGRTWRHVEA